MLTQSIFLLDFKSSGNWTDFFITGFGSQAVYSGIRWSSPIIQEIPERARLGQMANEFQLEKSNGQCWSAGSPEQRIVDPPHWGRKKRVMGWLAMPAGGIGSQSRSPYSSFACVFTISFYALNGSALWPSFLHLVHRDGESVKSTAESLPIKPITFSLSTALEPHRRRNWGEGGMLHSPRQYS